MRYETVFLNTFLKQFKKLPGSVKTRVEQRIDELAVNPFLGIRLRGSLEGFWKDRVGGYRIIYKIDSTTRKIVFSMSTSESESMTEDLVPFSG